MKRETAVKDVRERKMNRYHALPPGSRDYAPIAEIFRKKPKGELYKAKN